MTAHPARSGVILSLLVAAAVAGTASLALAKGPESATLTGSGIDRPIELMNTATPPSWRGSWSRQGSGTQPAIFRSAAGPADRARVSRHVDLDQLRRAR